MVATCRAVPRCKKIIIQNKGSKHRRTKTKNKADVPQVKTQQKHIVENIVSVERACRHTDCSSGSG